MVEQQLSKGQDSYLKEVIMAICNNELGVENFWEGYLIINNILV